MKPQNLPLLLAVVLTLSAAAAMGQPGEGTSNVPESLIGVDQGTIPGVDWNGTLLNGFTGGATSSAGDVDADGYSDILIGVPSWDNVLTGQSNIGMAFLIFGTPQSFQSQPIQPLTTFSPVFMVQFVGAEPQSATGYSVSGAGDVNGDGYADFLISAPGFKDNSGMVYLVYGQPRYLWTQRVFNLGALNPDPNRMTRIFGGAGGLRAGWSVSGAGDVNGDGFDDILIGIPNGNGGMGEAVLLFGRPGVLDSSGNINLRDLEYGHKSAIRFLGYRAGGTTGWSVSGVADFNFDGRWEILIGAPFGSGAPSGGNDEAYLIYGDDFSRLADGIFDLSTLSEATGFRIQHSLSTSIGMGWSVSGIGDFNGDGLGDIAIGSPLRDEGRGACYVIFGNLENPGGPDAEMDVDKIEPHRGGAFYTELPGLRTGFSVVAAGDVNNDGRADLLIGGPGPNPPGFPPNPIPTRAWLVYGNDFMFFEGPVNLDVIDGFFWGETWLEPDLEGLGGLAGFSVAGAGDFNRDQLFDTLIGVPGEDRCYLVFGQPISTPSGYQIILARNSDTPPLPIGILGDGSHALPLTRSWIDFSTGNMDPETTRVSVYFDTTQWQLYPYLMKRRFGWSVQAIRDGDFNIQFITKGTRTQGAHGWYDALFWNSGGGSEFDWLNGLQERDPLRVLLRAPLEGSFGNFDLGTAPDLSAPRIERAILIDQNDNGVADPNEKLVLVFSRAIIYVGFLEQNSFFLPVQGDTLGSTNFYVQENFANRRQLIVNLGEGVNLTIPGPFSIQNLTPGVPSGIDLIIDPTAPPDVVSVFGVPAIDNGIIGENDAAVDMRYDYVGLNTMIGPGGGIVGLLPSPDAEFTGHQLIIPPDAMPPATEIGRAVEADPVFRMIHPPDNFGVVNAVQVEVDRENFEFQKPAKLRLQILDSEVDTDNGYNKRDARIHQLIMGQWQLVPGAQSVDPENNFVEVEIVTLGPPIRIPGAALSSTATQGAQVASVGIFGNIFGETVEEATFNIKPAAGAAAIVDAALAEVNLAAAPVLKTGPSGAYTLHEIEFPGYELTTPTDPNRIEVKIRKPNLFDVYTTHGSNEVPGDLCSYFIVETRDASYQSIAFASPVNFKIQFFDGSKNTYDDLIKFDTTAGAKPDMTLFTDIRDGDDNEYAILPGLTRMIEDAVGGGLVVVTGVANLTGASGSKLWGAISDEPAPPPDESHGWMLR